MTFTYRPVKLILDTSGIAFSMRFPCPVCGVKYRLSNKEPKCPHLVLCGLDEEVYYLADSLNREGVDKQNHPEVVEEIFTKGSGEPLLVYSFTHRVLSAEERYFAFSYKEWWIGGIDFMNL